MTGRSGSVLWETIETIAIALVLTLVIRTFVVENFAVKGSSMVPTLQDGERILVNKFTYHFGEPRQGDIVVFRSPENPRDDLIKRVIATEGQRVEMVNGQVLIDGEPLEENYLTLRDRWNMGPQEVPPDGIWVLGDNRPNSQDSRFFGIVPVNSLKGKAVVIWWPLPLAAVLP